MNNKKSISITWHIDDVKCIDESITNDEAYLVLERVLNTHDAAIGINWDVLEFHLNDIIEERSNNKQYILRDALNFVEQNNPGCSDEENFDIASTLIKLMDAYGDTMESTWMHWEEYHTDWQLYVKPQ